MPSSLAFGAYQFGVSARPDVAPASYEDLYLLPEPQLSRISGVGAYVHNNEEVELTVFGAWEWYEDLPAPLVILTDHISGELAEIVPGAYGSAADGRQIKFTLPPIRPEHSGLMLEVSQTGALTSSPERSRLGFSLIARPVILDVSPRVIDSRAKGHAWVTVKGENFYKDGGLPEERTNIYCAIDEERTEMVYHNRSQVECLLRLETEVFAFDHSYEVAVSVNFGVQWARAPELAVRTIVLPEIASISPQKLSANLLTRIVVELRRSAQSAPTLTLEGFKVFTQEQLEEDKLALLVRPLERFAPGEKPVQISLSLPQIQYESKYTDLVMAGGTSLTGNSPRMVLAFWGWTELTLTGSHLDLQPLYCQIGEVLYEFTFDSDHNGTCLVALDPAMSTEGVYLVTALGETLPGAGEIEVVQGSAKELWPQLSHLSSATSNSIHLIGSGFRSGSSRCHIRGETSNFQVEADVFDAQSLSCLLPEGQTLSEIGPLVTVQIQNYYSEDLADFLWS